MSNIEAAANLPLVRLGAYASNRADRGRQAAPNGPADTPVEHRISEAAARDRSDLGGIQALNDRRNGEAHRIRSRDMQMTSIDVTLTRMKQELLRIVKNYPPYPPGEPERTKFLRSFNGLRQQIEKMTMPPDEKWLGPAPGQRSAGEAAMPDVRFTVPDLPDMADDASVQAAADEVDRMIAAVAERRQALAKEAEAVAQAETEAKAEELARRSTDGLTFSRFQERQAEQESGSAGQALQQLASHGLAAGSTTLLQWAG